MKKVFTVLMFSIIFIAVGCHKSKDKITVPLHAQFTTTSTILQEGPPELDSIHGTGIGTPIGKSSFIAHAGFDAAYNLTGKIIATAENGDRFFADITGHAPDVADDGSITLHFKAVITGGTGSLTGATGNFDGVAHESIYNAAGTATWDGTITN